MMKSIKLTKEETRNIMIVVENYKQIFNRIESVEKRLAELNNEKDTLINTLDDLRKTENKAISDIVSKYGKGKLNLETLEYELD